MPQLHETIMGRRFFEHDLPELNKNLNRIADALEKMLEQKSQSNSNLNSTPLKDNISLLNSIKIKDVFSIRISNALLYCRYPKHNLYQLVKSSERELMATKNFGAKCLHEIMEYLENKNLELDMTDEEILSKIIF